MTVPFESQERGSWSGLKDIPVAWRLPWSVVSKYDSSLSCVLIG